LPALEDYLDMVIERGRRDGARQDEQYRDAIALFGAALGRLAGAYEADPDARRDLLQDIHLALWRSFERFDGRCSLRTWVYRVAHNTAASHVTRAFRTRRHAFVGLEEIENAPDEGPLPQDDAAARRQALDRLAALIQRLEPLDRQIIVSYLEGMDAPAIAEIVGLSHGAVSTKVYRIKRLLAQRVRQGAHHDR
jgi:RNA polymerase sigma-70 factor (ECF subfamily)